MVGIGGAGMSGLARILLARGGQVSGSDAKESRGVIDLRDLIYFALVITFWLLANAIVLELKKAS